MALSRPQEHPPELETESADPSMFSPKSVTNKVLLPEAPMLRCAAVPCLQPNAGAVHSVSSKASGLTVRLLSMIT